MSDSKPYEQHLNFGADLVTPYGETRAGFVAIALEKNRQATPFVERARALKVSASQAQTASELVRIGGIQPALLTAAGVSDKAATHMSLEIKEDAIQGFIDNFLEPAGTNFVEELVFRFLLTRGDSLGGKMRNLTGQLAERKLTRAIISTLSNAGISYYWLSKKNDQWVPSTENDPDVELLSKGLSWVNNGQTQTVLYNRKVPLVRKNVDICLLNCNHRESHDAIRHPNLYVLLGELKGGIDPAGADEHWKTANSALQRIRDSFSNYGHPVQTFFIGAAIENDMANEIWTQLENDTLNNAANLTSVNQVASLCRWLCNL